MKNILRKIGLLFHNPIVSAEYSDEIMTLTYKNGDKAQYAGNCTVWYTFPYYVRCSTSMEIQLVSIWKYIGKFGNPYPTAHLNKKKKK